MALALLLCWALQCAPKEHWAREYLDQWYDERSVVRGREWNRQTAAEPTAAAAEAREGEGDDGPDRSSGGAAGPRSS